MAHGRRSQGLGVAGFLVLVILGALTKVEEFIGDTSRVFGVILLILLGLLLAFLFKQYLQYQEQDRRAAEEATRKAALEYVIAQTRIPTERSAYLISNTDYRRGTPRENFYRKAFLLTLLRTFENRCARCGTHENGVDLDHFVFSKNEGGSFAMFHCDGYWVNNAIPLCEGCNRGKGDRSYADFFTDEILADIFEKNARMTRLLNDNALMEDFRPTALMAALKTR